MNKRFFFAQLVVLVSSTIFQAAQKNEWPNYIVTDEGVKKFVNFYKKDLQNIAASVSIVNKTGSAIIVDSETVKNGNQKLIDPVKLMPEGGLRVGSVIDIKNQSGEQLGTLGINIASRGYFISRHPKDYTNPTDVFEKAIVDLSLGKTSNYAAKEFDIYKLKKAKLKVYIVLEKDLYKTTMNAQID